ncbi:chemosensory receptor C [Elysia marginata]|uniref:Chemosensory receptor C n=1 Tax=Elysia marginata TaxID=1093978 RepID=A0AAV4HHA8_9GAST|nr:chemosensory receptor C [Elysia marginata]
MENLPNVTEFGVDTSEDIMTEGILWVSAVTVRVCVDSALAVCSFVTNIINCLVFKRMGLDHTTEPFFILSFSDCLIGFLSILGGVLNGLRYLGPARLTVSVYTLYLQALVPAVIASVSSMASTTVIAVVRCCSVASPLRVHMLTARRQRVAILVCTGIAMAFVGYGVSSTRLEVVTNNQTNTSHLIMKTLPDYIQRNKFPDMFRVVLFYICFLTVNVCLVILITALWRSYKFRESSTNRGDIHNKQSENIETQAKTTKRFAGFKPASKEAQVVKVVVLVAAVFTVCNIPIVVATTFRLLDPRMAVNGALYRSFDFVMMMVECFSLINTSVNIIIYLKFNSRYYTSFRNTIFRNQ